MPAVKTGFTPPPMPGMPAPMQPMGGMPPAQNPFAPMPPMPLAGSPPPPMQPMPPMAQGQMPQGQQQQMMGSTAGRRRRFGDALEGMLGRNQGIGAMPQQQRPMPPQMMPQQRMVAPGTPMMRTPPMGRGVPRPMAMGGEVDIFGYEGGGPVQYYEDAGEVKLSPSGFGATETTYGVTMARDSEGNIVPGMFVAKYADGSYSAPVPASQVEGLRQGLLTGRVTSGDYTAEEAGNMAAKDVYLRSGGISVTDRDVSGGFGSPLGMSNEMLGSDVVFVQFPDGSKVTTQKGMIDAMNEYGLLSDIQSRDDFNKITGAISAASVRDPESDLGKAYSLFSEKQREYNEALRASDPNIQKNIDTFRGYYAPEPAAEAPVDTGVDQITGAESGPGTAVGADANFGTGVYEGSGFPQSGATDYTQFRGNIGRTLGGYPEGQRTPEMGALFGPNVGFAQTVSQYYTDPVTGGLTTTFGPEMGSVSPIGGALLPARPVEIDIFDFLSTPTYGTMYSRDPYSIDPEEMAMGGEVSGPFGGSVPRNTMIGDQPHMLAYINPQEANLLSDLGGTGEPGPGGIPAYRNLDADLGVGAINSGKTYSGSDKAVSGGYSHPTDNDDDSPSNVTPVPTGTVDFTLPPTSDDDKPAVIATIDYGSDDDDGPLIKDVTYYDDTGVNEIDAPVVTTDTAYVDPNTGDVTYTDRFGREYGTQTEADVANQMYAAQLASYGAGKVGFDRFKADAASAFPGRDREDTDRMAARAYPDFVEDYSRDINIFDADVPQPFSYTGIGAIGAGPEGGGLGITPAPVVDSDPNTGQEGPSFVKSRSGLLDSSALESGPVISLDAPVQAGAPAPDYATMPMGEMGRGTAMPLTGSADMPPELLPMTTLSEGSYRRGTLGDDAIQSSAYQQLFNRSVEKGYRGADMPSYSAEKDLIEMAKYPDSEYNNLDKIDYKSLMAPDLQRGLGNAGIIAARDADMDPFGTGTQVSLQDVKDRVARAEGTADAGGYGRLLGNQEGRFGVDLTDMTVQEVLDFQKKRGPGSYAEYSQGVNKQRGMTRADGSGVISTPAGKYQVVGATLEDLIDKGIVDPNAKFDEGTQEKIGSYLIAERRGLNDLQAGNITREQFEANLAKEFEGIERGLDKGAGSTSTVIAAASETGRQAEVDRRDENVEKIKAQIGDQAEPTGVEAFFYDVIGQLGLGLGKGLADDLRGKSREARQAIIDQHAYALANGATPKTDEEGNYIGFDISTMDTFADKMLAAEDIMAFMPPSTEASSFTVTQDMIDSLRASGLNAQADALTVGQTLNLPAYSNPAYQADADGDSIPDSERFAQIYDAQKAAADAMPKYDNFIDYLLGAGPAGSTEQGFITPDGKEFFVDAGGNVVEVTDSVVPFEVGGGDDVAAALGLTETITGGDDDAATAGPDTGHVDGVCNTEGYVYNPETDMCEPPSEEEGSDKPSLSINRPSSLRSFQDILGGVATPGPKIAPISANIRPMQGGGMAGLNRAADNFLKALAG